MSNVFVELSEAFAAAVNTAGNSVVLVNARRRLPASGVAFAADLILTADHVLEREEGIHVGLPDGTLLSAQIAGRDALNDLAVLRLETVAVTPAIPAAPARVGQFALALGRPSPDGIEASFGVVSALGGPVHTPHGVISRYIRAEFTAYPGFSGGALIDAHSAVLGINTSFGRGMPFTIPSDIAWKVAQQLATHGVVQRGYLGIRSQIVEISGELQATLRREQPTGLLIVAIEPNSPAAEGLIVGDILVSIDGQAIRTHDELFVSLNGIAVGTPVDVEVLRGGQTQHARVTLGTAPAESPRKRHAGG